MHNAIQAVMSMQAGSADWLSAGNRFATTQCLVLAATCRLAGMKLAARSCAGSHCWQAVVLAGQHVQTGRAVLAVLAGVLRCALAVCSWCYQARLMFYVGWGY